MHKCAVESYNYQLQLTVCYVYLYTAYINAYQLHFNFTCFTIKGRTVPLACINLLYHHISQNDCKGKIKNKKKENKAVLD